MINTFHFLRPWWLLLFVLLSFMIFRFFKKKTQLQGWASICDQHLLDSMLIQFPTPKRHLSKFLIVVSMSLLILGLAGPTWTRLPVPTYTQVQPKVFLLDLSKTMLEKDLQPNRLERAKFILHDIFSKYKLGQFGLIAYTGEPFIVSPLTDDVQTIEALLSSLHPNIVPIGGQRLDRALEQAQELINQAKFNHGQIVVLTATQPNQVALNAAKNLAQKHILTSIMPIIENKNEIASFNELATAGQGKLLDFSKSSKELLQLFSSSRKSTQLERQENNDIPLWKDEGRWFLLPALLFLLPAFRKGWMQRIF